MVDDLYQEEILDHYKNPRNFGPPPRKFRKGEKSVAVRESNASCGDMVELWLVVDGEGKVVDIGFRGVGCAISMAAASMLTEKIKNEKLKMKSIEEWGEAEMEELLGTRVGAARIKCVMLPLKAVKKAIEEIRNNESFGKAQDK